MKYPLSIFAIALLLLSGCKEKKKYHDEMPEVSVEIANSGLAGVLEFQKKLNEEYRDPERSPLPDRYRKNFETLDFFPPDTNYIVTARLVRTPDALPFLMPTTTDRKSKEVLYGVAHFTLNGEKRQLEIYQNQELMQQEEYHDYLFLPFTDNTNGEETYEGGRYLDLRIPEGDSIVLDFNKAYNPYCAYNKKYSCPIVPGVNTLDTEVRAGVRAFEHSGK